MIILIAWISEFLLATTLYSSGIVFCVEFTEVVAGLIFFTKLTQIDPDSKMSYLRRRV